jgi:hypothetical protein
MHPWHCFCYGVYARPEIIFLLPEEHEQYNRDTSR